MLCPGTHNQRDNPGCRHGGCQGRLPPLPLFQAASTAEAAAASLPLTSQAVTVAVDPGERIAA